MLTLLSGAVNFLLAGSGRSKLRAATGARNLAHRNKQVYAVASRSAPERERSSSHKAMPQVSRFQAMPWMNAMR